MSPLVLEGIGPRSSDDLQALKSDCRYLRTILRAIKNVILGFERSNCTLENIESPSFLTKRGEGTSARAQVWTMPLFGGEARQLTAACI
jgi:hypothetical protein